jgi:hypothetical protein
MKRLLVLLLLLLPLPMPAAAQEVFVPASGPSAVDSPAAVDGPAVVDDEQRPPAPAARPDPGARRRPSMVGYVDDSSISSKVRIRYDAGYGMESPDRAEFFYAKCGCYRGLPPSNPAYDPNAPGPGPGVVSNLNFGQLYILGEFAPSEKFSVFAQLPFRFLRPDTFVPGTGSFGNQNGLSDITFGAKGALISKPERQLTAQLQIGTPTGDAAKGLGTNHATIEPSLLYEERPNDRFAFEAEFGDVIPTSGSAGVPTSSADNFSASVIYYGIGPSYEAYRSPALSIVPVVELVGWHVTGGFQTPSNSTDSAAGGWDIVNIKFGARLMFKDHSSMYIGYGHALTSDSWYNNILRLEYRVALGR